MQLFCPACQSPFTGLSRCPRCGGLLLMPDEAVLQPPDPDAPAARPARPTAAGRLAVGTIASLGAYVAFRKFLAGWATAAAADPDGWWATDDGLAAVLAAQAGAVILGAVLAGSGRVASFWLGALIGGGTGALFLAAELVGGAPAGHLVLVVQPVVLAAIGGVAGAVGGRVWAGVPELEFPAPAARRSSSIQLGEVTPPPSGRPTQWARILFGAVIVAAGVGFADPARRVVERNSQGAVRAASMGQARFLSTQLATMAVLAGAAAAAAGTGAGIRHGLLAALLGSCGVAAMTYSLGALPVPAVYLVEHMNLDPTQPNNPAVLTALASGLLVGGLVGGWLGGTLFLPLAPEHMRRRVRMID